MAALSHFMQHAGDGPGSFGRSAARGTEALDDARVWNAKVLDTTHAGAILLLGAAAWTPVVGALLLLG